MSGNLHQSSDTVDTHHSKVTINPRGPSVQSNDSVKDARSSMNSTDSTPQIKKSTSNTSNTLRATTIASNIYNHTTSSNQTDQAASSVSNSQLALATNGCDALLLLMTREEIRNQGFDSWISLPRKLRKHDSGFDELCPQLTRKLEEKFLPWHDQYLRENCLRFRGSPLPLIASSCIICAMLVDALGDLAFNQDSEVLENGLQLITTLNLIIWSVLFFFANRNKDLLKQINLDRRVRIWTIVCLLSFCAFLSIRPALEGKREKAIRYSTVLMVTGAGVQFVPVTVSLKAYLAVFFGVGYSSWVGCFFGFLESDASSVTSASYHCAWLFWGLSLLFMNFRAAAIQHRLTFLGQLKLMVQNNLLQDLERQHDKGQLNELIRQLEDPEMKRKLQECHQTLVRGYVNFSQTQFDTAPSHQIEHLEADFMKMKSLCFVETRRLRTILNKIYQRVSELPHWQFIQLVPNFDNFQRRSTFPKEKVHQKGKCIWWECEVEKWFKEKPEISSILDDVIGLENDHIAWYTTRAKWARKQFEYIMRQVVKDFNNAKVPEDLLLDAGDIFNRWNSEHPTQVLSRYPFEPDVALEDENLNMMGFMASQYIEHGVHCGLQFGPQKDRARVEAKVLEYQQEAEKDPDGYPDFTCFAKYVCDWLRGRVVFSNPQTLAVFFWFLNFQVPEISVVRGKNKLVIPPQTDPSLDIHLNVCFDVQGEEFCAELQLTLESVMLARDLGHKCYELERASRVSDILNPVFEYLPPKDIKPMVRATQRVRHPSLDSLIVPPDRNLSRPGAGSSEMPVTGNVTI